MTRTSSLFGPGAPRSFLFLSGPDPKKNNTFKPWCQDDDPILCHRIAEAALERQRRLGRGTRATGPASSGRPGDRRGAEGSEVGSPPPAISSAPPLFNRVIRLEFRLPSSGEVRESIVEWSWSLSLQSSRLECLDTSSGPYTSTLELATCIQDWWSRTTQRHRFSSVVDRDNFLQWSPSK